MRGAFVFLGPALSQKEERRVELNQRKLLSLKSWKELAEKGEAPKDAVVLVSVDIPDVKQLDQDGNVYRFVISTANPDRDKDIIKADGWRFENYNKNPVVLFGHNYRSLPVATGSPPTVDGDKVLSNADFSATKSDTFAETVRQYVKAKVLRASSVGFDPLKWMYNEERRGYDFVEQELLEWSIVPVPANAEALQLAKDLKLDFEPIKQWAIQALDYWSEEKGVYVPRSVLESAAKIGDSDRVFILFPKNQLDNILDGSALSEKTEPAPETSASVQWPAELRSVLHEIRDAIKDLAGAISKDKPAEPPAQPDKKDAGEGAVLILSEDEEKNAGAEVLFDVDPEELRAELREGMKEVLAPIIMQRTGRVV
jgi:HK97 family phage prohead protease